MPKNSLTLVTLKYFFQKLVFTIQEDFKVLGSRLQRSAKKFTHPSKVVEPKVRFKLIFKPYYEELETSRSFYLEVTMFTLISLCVKYSLSLIATVKEYNVLYSQPTTNESSCITRVTRLCFGVTNVDKHLDNNNLSCYGSTKKTL